jgi:predicted heme/steroid binding protein
MKKSLVIISILLLCTLFAFMGCGTKTDEAENADSVASEAVESDADDAELVMTSDELSQYDGKDGNPAYIAVDGVIYDVSNVSQWRDGEHNGYSAGQDLTDEIYNISPHGTSKLKSLPVVGKLED